MKYIVQLTKIILVKLFHNSPRLAQVTTHGLHVIDKFQPIARGFSLACEVAYILIDHAGVHGKIAKRFGHCIIVVRGHCHIMEANVAYFICNVEERVFGCYREL